MNEFNLKSVFSFNPNDIEIKDFGIKVNNDLVDYAVLKCSYTNTFWYDVDDGIQISDYNENKKYFVSYNFKNNNVNIQIYFMNPGGIINKQETCEFPFEEYTEESFFMMSTIHNVGEFDFETFNAFKNSVLKIKEIIKAIEEAQ